MQIQFKFKTNSLKLRYYKRMSQNSLNFNIVNINNTCNKHMNEL